MSLAEELKSLDCPYCQEYCGEPRMMVVRGGYMVGSPSDCRISVATKAMPNKGLAVIEYGKMMKAWARLREKSDRMAKKPKKSSD